MQLENKLKHFTIILSVSSPPDIVKEYEECRAKLESINDHIAQGIILRSKVTWYEKGEKPNRYFLNIEKRNKTKTHIRKLLIDNQTLPNPTAILQKIKCFYNSLYTGKSLKTEQECLNYLTDINTPLLSEHEGLSCESNLTLKEIYQVLESMPEKKSPGNDGLSKEFYLSFFDLLGQPLLESLNAAYDEGELSPFQRQAIITLIEKKRQR